MTTDYWIIIIFILFYYYYSSSTAHHILNIISVPDLKCSMAIRFVNFHTKIGFVLIRKRKSKCRPFKSHFDQETFIFLCIDTCDPAYWVNILIKRQSQFIAPKTLFKSNKQKKRKRLHRAIVWFVRKYQEICIDVFCYALCFMLFVNNITQT